MLYASQSYRRPETYFTFDTKTGEVVPMKELEPRSFRQSAKNDR